MIDFRIVQRVKKALFEIEGVEEVTYIKTLRKWHNWVIIKFRTRNTEFAEIQLQFDSFQCLEIHYGKFGKNLQVRFPLETFEEEKFKEVLKKIFKLYEIMEG